MRNRVLFFLNSATFVLFAAEVLDKQLLVSKVFWDAEHWVGKSFITIVDGF